MRDAKKSIAGGAGAAAAAASGGGGGSSSSEGAYTPAQEAALDERISHLEKEISKVRTRTHGSNSIARARILRGSS